MQIFFNNIHPKIIYLNKQVRPVAMSTKLSQTDSVSFCGASSDDLLAQNSKFIIDKVKKSIREENSLGRGGEAEVYKIPDTNYCVRVPHDSFDRLGRTVNKNISAEDAVNHTVAKLANGVTIMPIIEGFSFCSDNIENSQVAKMIEQMPNTAVEKLLKQICNAYNHDMAFDTGWKNIIVNPVKKTLTAIDFIPRNDIFPGDRILGCVYLSLANNLDTTTAQRKVLAGKLLSAVADNILSNDGLIKDVYALGLTDFVRVLTSHNIFENINSANVLRNVLLKVGDLKSQQVLGGDIVNQLDGQIKVLKSLIKRIF